MNAVREYVHDLSENDLIQICFDYETFEIVGSIGDCVLRKHTNILMKKLGARTDVTTWMRDLTFEAWRRRTLILENSLDSINEQIYS